MMDDLTWTCHICDEERPDAMISVHKKEALLPGNVPAPVIQNIRYCNDRPSCIDGAINKPPLDLRGSKKS